ncbi:MAG: hypothetical protein JWM04_387 [Verrucomicrobiales bacterium]|nr:hypothetical protein [Verrucomicrobiales bacterium]
MKLFAVLLLLAVSVVAANATLDVTIGLNFKGSSEGVESIAVPSDCNGTIGPNHFVEFLNGVFAVYNRTNGNRISLSTDLAFWQNAGITFAAGVDISDPRLIYDAQSGRWFACMIDVPLSQVNNRILLAVSKTSDPTAGWRAVSINADVNRFADFPTMGIDANAIYIGSDSFDGSGTYRGVAYSSIPKADLLGTVLSLARRSSSGTLSPASRGNTPHPIVNFGGTGPGLILTTENNGVDFQPHSTLKLVQVNNSGAAGATFSAATLISVPSYSIPINPQQPDATQSDFDDGDCRFGAKPYQIGNIIYAAHTVDLPNGSTHHAGIRWYKIDATAKTLIQSGTISNALEFFYPSICANSNGVVVLNMNGCSTTQYVSSYAVVGETVTNNTTFGQPILLKAGTATYDDGGGFGGTSRWGDYSAVTPDPNSSDHFWAIQNIATGGQEWSTQITEIIAAQVLSPTVTIDRSNNKVLLQWLTTATGFALEETPSLNPPIFWTSVSTSPVSANGTNTVTIPANQPMDIFRLKR